MVVVRGIGPPTLYRTFLKVLFGPKITFPKVFYHVIIAFPKVFYTFAE